jgi:hypothetical protein
MAKHVLSITDLCKLTLFEIVPAFSEESRATRESSDHLAEIVLDS